MSRHWIVDASNVVGSRPDGWWRDRSAALARLIDEIIRWRATIDDTVTVVVDGLQSGRVPEGTAYGVEVRYAHANHRDAADDEIVGMVARESNAQRLTVVTSDGGLRHRVAEFGGAAERARQFLTRLADIEPRRQDRAVLSQLGVEESALLGRGGEARVFALGSNRVLRLSHPGVDVATLEERRRLLDVLATGVVPVSIPEVLEQREIDGRFVAIERRLSGHNALDALAEDDTDREALIRHHLEIASRIVEFVCPAETFGEFYGEGAISAPTFRSWAEARLAASLRCAGPDFAHLDAAQLTDDLVAALGEPEPKRPMLVHLDAFLGNMLAENSRITALLDFGPMTIGGPPQLDPLAAVAYLAPEITPTATAHDRAVARAWADDAGLTAALVPAQRWIAAYWTAAIDDQRLHRWCERALLSR